MPEETSLYMSQSSVRQNKASIIKETKDDVLFRACIQEGDLLNRNNKIYPTAQIDAALKNELIQQQIKTGTWYGEANHPMDQRIERQLYLDMKNVSHSIRSADRKGTKFYADILTTQNEQGRFMKGSVCQDAIISFSMRGIHQLAKEGTHWIVKNLKIFTYDWVPVPSHHGAMMVAANESAQIVDDEHVRIERDAIKAVLASEGIGSIAMIEDLLDGEIESSVASRDTVSLKNGSTIIGFKAKRSLTHSILSDLF